MNKLSQFLPLPLASVVFLLSFLAYLAAGPSVLVNPDTPWHLMAGDAIRASGIPETDPWSFSAAGTPWYNLSWAWDALISAIAVGFGLSGLYMFTAAAASSVLALLYCTAKSRRAASDLYVLITLLLLWYVLLMYLCPQPWLATILLTALFHHLLHKSREERDWRSLRWLPLLMIPWANLHGGFIVGLSMIAMYAIEAQQTGNHAWMKRLLACGAVAGAACFANPYGIYIVPGVLRTMHSVITPYLADWQPLPVGWMTAPTVFLMLFMFCSNSRDSRMPPAEKMLVFAWLFYGLITRRNFVIFAVLAVPYFAYSLEAFARYAQGAKFTTVDHFSADTYAQRARFFLAAMLVTAIVAATPLKGWLIEDGKLSDDPHHLRPALDALKPYAKHRFLNDYNMGGYLIYLSKGAWPVFVDGRAGTAYSEDVLQDSIDLAALSPGYQKIFSKYNAGGIVVFSDHRFARQIGPDPRSGWKEVYRDESVSAYIRKAK